MIDFPIHLRILLFQKGGETCSMHCRSVLLSAALLVLLGNAWGQTIEITESDLFDLGKLPNSEDLLVSGLSLKNSLIEAIALLKPPEWDVYRTGSWVSGHSYYFSIPGMTVYSWTKDKPILSIQMERGFKSKLKGKTAAYFDVTTLEEFEKLVVGSFGQPDYKDYGPGGKTYNEFESLYYLEGFIFSYNRPTTGDIKIVLSTKKHLIAFARTAKAKKLSGRTE